MPECSCAGGNDSFGCRGIVPCSCLPEVDVHLFKRKPRNDGDLSKCGLRCGAQLTIMLPMTKSTAMVSPRALPMPMKIPPKMPRIP